MATYCNEGMESMVHSIYRRLGRLILLGALAYSGSALACTSAASGNWNAASTWTSCGGGIPGTSTAQTTIASGHTVTVTDERTFGTSPADTTTFVLVVQGNLRIDAGGLLRMRGNGQLNNAPLNIEQGGVFEIDGSVSGQSYILRVGSATNQANAKVNLNGTGFANMPEFRSTEGGPNGRIWRGASTTGTGMVNCTYGRIRRLGSTSNLAIWFNPAGSNFSWVWNYCSLEDSSQVRVESTMNAAAVFEVRNSRAIDVINQDSQTEKNPFVVSGNNAFTTGRLVFEDNYLERGLGCLTCAGLVARRNILLAAPGTTSGFGAVWSPGSGSVSTILPYVQEDNFILSRATSGGVRNGFGTIRGNYYASLAANPHFQGTNTIDPNGTLREYNVFEALRTVYDSDAGDVLTFASGGSSPPYPQITRFNLLAGHTYFSCLVSALGGPTQEAYIYNNTGNIRECSLRFSETEPGFAGMFKQLTSNALYDTGTGVLRPKAYPLGTTVDNLMDECDYNGAGNFAVGSLGNGYSGIKSIGTCGANDLNEDMQIADPTFRGIGKFYAWVTNTPFVAGDDTGSSFAALRAEWRKKNTADWDPRFDHIRARDWVWAGYAPRNLKYATRGKNGGQIGAVKVWNAATPLVGAF